MSENSATTEMASSQEGIILQLLFSNFALCSGVHLTGAGALQNLVFPGSHLLNKSDIPLVSRLDFYVSVL